MFRSNHRLCVSLLCLLIFAPALFGQTDPPMATVMNADITHADQLRLAAPSSSGQTGLFETVTADTLRRGDVSFGLYFQDYDLLSAAAPLAVRPLTRRSYRDQSYDLYRLNASVGFGVTDRWELTLMAPWDRLKGNGGDRAGFVKGWLYSGRFSGSSVGPVRIATKFGVSPMDSSSRVAVSAFADLGTGETRSGISTGNRDFGFGMQWTQGIGTFDASYKVSGDRRFSDVNYGTTAIKIPNEFNINGGLNVPVGFWHATNWIGEVNARAYNGGDFRPKAPIFLVSGLRHWFGDSGWSVNAAARWNVRKYGYDRGECRFTELDDCGLGGIVGLTFAPLHLAQVFVPPPAPIAPPPPPPAPVAPPEPPPVAPPHQPTELRADEIHFEPGSARLTNIAKAVLDDVALRMKQAPASTAIVIGFTDNKESAGENADLDRRRAQAVRDYLVSRHGVDASRITVEGHNGKDPVGDNSTAEGRLRNRRVVIRLIIP